MPQTTYMERVSADPVLSNFELPLRRRFYPFGFPLELETNSAGVMAAASEGWNAFGQIFDQAPVRICLGVLEGSGDLIAADVVFRSREHVMSIVADPENFMVCDFKHGFAFGWVTESTVADHPLLRYRFLTAAGTTLVEQRVFTALHGALVSRNGKGVMLAGDSFAGKSTLAYACARSGWSYVSDDGVFLVRGRNDRYAIGDPHSIRFRPDAPKLFPELANHLTTIRPNGKAAIEIFTSELALQTAPGCHVEHVVYLVREQPGATCLRPLSEDFVREDWSRYNFLGTREVREARKQSCECLLRAQLWEIHYSDLDEAVALLEQLVDSGA
ncbi:MAG: hypothetical protein JOZ32_05300 [Bryobacterales bacterium]|nr:hypothetical protein [Bryobacterales bacterium]